MKKFGKILIFALSLVIALSAFAIASSANTSPFLVEGLYRDTWEDAIENAYIKGDRVVPVELRNDYEANGESVEITESVVIFLDGHTLKSATGAPLFSVSGKDTTLTIIGPGTISCAGTLVEVKSGSFVFDASRGLSITSDGADSVAIIGGEGEKAYAGVSGAVAFESSGASLFELASGGEFKLATGNSVTAKPSATATDGFPIVLANAGSKVNLTGGSLTNSGGCIFKLGDDTEAEAPVEINCESAVLVSDSATYGSIVEAGSAYANVNIRYSEITASGGAFSADNTLASFEGEGRDKVYAKPTLRVNFTVSVYNVDSLNANANASLFYGNVTGIVTASEIWNTDTSFIGINTRLWDGECGVLLKKGNKLSLTTKTIESSLAAPLKDEDGTTVYFNPKGSSNNNFSLEIIDGESCKLYKATDIAADNSFISYMMVTNETPYFVDTDYSSNFNDPAGLHPTAEAVTHSYGYIGYETVKDADGVENRFYKWEYDKNKKDQYSFASGNSWFELDAGGGGATRVWNGFHKNAYITWDFDISTTNGTYSYAGLKLFIREATSSYAYTDNFATITGNSFKVNVTNVSKALPTTPYQWAHITLVFEIDTTGSYEKDGKTVYPNLGNTMIHYYIDGEYLSSNKAFNANISTEDGIKRSAEFSLDAIRFGLSSGTGVNKDTSTSLIFDNNIVTYYPVGYKGNVSEADRESFSAKVDDYTSYIEACSNSGIPATKSLRDFTGDVQITLGDVLINKSLSLKDAHDVVYKKGYRSPGTGVSDSDDRPISAIVDGVKYYDVEDALRAISDGSVVYLYTDVESQYNANVPFTVYTKKQDGGNYKFGVVSDAYYLSEIRENGEVVGYKTLLANSFITIYWQINTGYKTEVPLGIVPSYDWIVPSSYYDESGRYIELLGWSTDKNATTPDEMEPISKDDIIKGYKVYYPVIGPSRVPLSFYNEKGEIIKNPDGTDLKVEIPVGTESKNLTAYNNGSSLPALPIENNEWYESCFSGWTIPGGVVGWEPVIATPEFEDIRIKASAIKTSFTVVRLVDFTPSLYLLKPDADSIPESDVEKIKFQGFSLDGKTLLGESCDWGNKYLYDVKIDEKAYYKLNFARSNNSSKPGASSLYNKGTLATLEDFPVYIHYTYNGLAKVNSVTLSLSSYLEAAFANAGAKYESAADEAQKLKADNEKSAILEIMRLIMNYMELAQKKDSPIYALCKKYVEDASNAKYLRDYTKVMDSVSPQKIAYNETIIEGNEGYIENNIRWNFVTNSITIVPTSKHAPYVNGYSVDSPAVDVIMIQSKSAFKSSSDGKGRARMGNSTTTVDGKYAYVFSFIFGSNDNYSTSMIEAYDPTCSTDASDIIAFDYYTNYWPEKTRTVFLTKYYSLTAHIMVLTSRIDEINKEIEDGKITGESLKAELEAELKMAQIIVSSQLALADCANANDTDIVGTLNPPAASLPER